MPHSRNFLIPLLFAAQEQNIGNSADWKMWAGHAPKWLLATRGVSTWVQTLDGPTTPRRNCAKPYLGSDTLWTWTTISHNSMAEVVFFILARTLRNRRIMFSKIGGSPQKSKFIFLLGEQLYSEFCHRVCVRSGETKDWQTSETEKDLCCNRKFATTATGL